MKRLTTNNPTDGVSHALNRFYIKDNETWVREGSNTPGFPDISLNELVREIKATHDIDVDISSDETISEEMYELLAEGTDTVKGIVAMLYAAAWAFSALRERLEKVEDILGDDYDLDEIDEIPVAGDIIYWVDEPEYGVITCKVIGVDVYDGYDVAGNGFVHEVTISTVVIEGHADVNFIAFCKEDFGDNVFRTPEEAQDKIERIKNEGYGY